MTKRMGTRTAEALGRLAGWALVLASLVPADASAQEAPAMDTTMRHETPGADASEMTMMAPGPLGISHDRDGSGTSWLPDATPMAAVHRMAGAWELMLHGNAFVQYIDQRGDRGDAQFGSINWLMGMAQRPWMGGEIGLRTMMSAEPFTIPDCGYPLLLATGELCDGEPIHDAQHPHDLFMELAGRYRHALGDALALDLYGGPAGEPALGPVAFPHRTSALPNPLAPIGHHWMDATHISFGVATAGLYGRRWKLEGSLFNGREPDENRLDLDLAPLDSYSGRLSLLPGDRWSLQLSAGHLNEAEPAEAAGGPRIDVTRYSGSATYDRPLADGGMWASTGAFGRNVEDGEGRNALLLETSLSLAERHLLFARTEWVQKSGEDLALDDGADGTYGVAAAAVGYTRQFDSYHGWLPGLGARASVNFIPRALESAYGRSGPLGFGFTVFASFRPAAMVMAMRGAQGDMSPQTMPGMDHGPMNMMDPTMDMSPKAPTDTSAMAMPGMEMGARSDEERAIDFIVRLLSNPEVAARIQADPALRRLWNDPAVQERLQRLRDPQPGAR